MQTPTPELTQTEQAIVYALADGDTVVEIALEHRTSTQKIRGHQQHLYRKLGAKNATHAVALAYHYGILVPRTPVDAPAP